MKDVKDNFSGSASIYAAFRPLSPEALYDFLFSQVNNFDTAWDCGTGNGQVAVRLAERFKKVYATDISAKQLEQAPKKDNIIYKVERAEHTSFPDNSIDLVTAAQTVHWFDFDAFNKEVHRIARPGAIIAIWTYVLLRINPEVDKVIDHLYADITYDYWDNERRHVDAKYQTIPFPYEEIATPEFEIIQQWNREQLLGYLHTWSGVQHYINKEKQDPIALILPKLERVWPADEIKEIRFPLYMRAGKIK